MKTHYQLLFFSIDKNYRSNGYSHLICDSLFQEANKRNKEIQTSTYTVLGKSYLQHLFNSYAKKYNVIFHDKEESDYLHDTPCMYEMVGNKLLHKSEIYG